MSDFSPGTHLLIDHRGGKGLDDPALLEHALRHAAEAAGAEVLHLHAQAVPGRSGVTGVALLADGLIGVQTWADDGYAAFDVLIPGDGKGKVAADRLARDLLPDWTQIKAVKRNDFTPVKPPQT